MKIMTSLQVYTDLNNLKLNHIQGYLDNIRIYFRNIAYTISLS